MSIYGDSKFIKKVRVDGDERIIPTTSSYINYSGRYHVNTITGDDNNDGLTAETPFKTLEKVMEMLNNGMQDVRCFIEEDGIYNLSKNNLNNCSLHITATKPNVTINYDFDDKGATFYNCHLNFKGDVTGYPLKIKTNSIDTQLMVIENCAVNFENVEIDNFKLVEVYGGGFLFTKCILPAVWTDYTNGEFDSLTITKGNIQVPLVFRRSSFISMRNNITLNYPTSTTNIMNIERSDVNMYPLTFLTSGNKTSGKSIQARTSTIKATTDVINAFDSLASTSHDFSAITTWIKTNTTLPN